MPPPPVAPKPSGVNPSRNVSKTIRREGRGERERERVGEKSGRIVSAVSQSVENRRSLRNKLGLRRREKREERREKREERREKREERSYCHREVQTREEGNALPLPTARFCNPALSPLSHARALSRSFVIMMVIVVLVCEEEI
jgi:hypothetical protein